ncbi:MAG: phospholipid carrier-dependent glycosyltransferase [Anaerolineaceae bacterium]|nr:phospholipid carrier-dependent glycosyltransferase [Anaerolineaceae bacterium]MDE0329097.1 phospholipid carrier-dependent glycosyltransferase [Anaerolineaceae bacterium]
MSRRQQLAVALWLALLIVYVLAGVDLAPFHGDEALQIRSSVDYFTLFIEGYSAALGVRPDDPRSASSDRRLLQGSITPWTIGLAWHLAGHNSEDLPPQPGWDWALDYDTNLALGLRPAPQLLLTSRYPSALFFALSVPLLYFVAWRLGGIGAALAASALYALHPALLLNGRRALMEGPLLFFGLLTICCALMILRRGEGAGLRWWLALALSGGLALASKHSALLFLGGALGWCFLAALLQRDRQVLLAATLRCVLSAALALTIFLALSPALWPDPWGGLQRLVRVRSELVQVQVQNLQPGGVGMSLAERLDQVLTQPYLRSAMFYEVASWSEYEAITAEIEIWRGSPLSGIPVNPLTGGVLSLLTLAGFAQIGRKPEQVGLLAWLALTLVVLLLNPLPWQRYYLPLLPMTCLLAALGMTGLLGRATLWRSKVKRKT